MPTPRETSQWKPWKREAACLGVSWEETHGVAGESTRGRNIREKNFIATYCLGCKVLGKCLNEAIEQRDRFGVRAGTTEGDRRNYFAKKMTRAELEVSGIKRVYGKTQAKSIAAQLAELRKQTSSEIDPPPPDTAVEVPEPRESVENTPIVEEPVRAESAA